MRLAVAVAALVLAGETVAQTPPAPVLIEPANGATVPYQPGHVYPYLTWARVAGAETYRMQVARAGSGFGDLLADEIVSTTNFCGFTFTCAPFFVPESGAYEWRVRVEGGSGVGAWSEEWVFTAELEVATEPGATAGRAALLGPSPNPSMGAVAFGARISEAGEAMVRVLDIAGREVALFHQGPLGAGDHGFVWRPSVRARGFYLVELIFMGERDVRSVVVL